MPPQLSVNEFLNSHGIRFLDNLSNIRRNTIGKPETTDLSPVNRVILGNTIGTFMSIYEASCGNLSNFITSCRAEISSLETIIDQGCAVLDKATKDNSLVQQLKTTKNWARSMAKYDWSMFKKEQEQNIINEIIVNISLLELESDSKDLFELDDLESELGKLQDRIDISLAKKKEYESFDLEAIERMDEAINEQQASIDNFQQELDLLLAPCSELETSNEMVSKLASLEDAIKHLENVVNSNYHISPQDLAMSRKKFQLSQAFHGFNLKKITNDEIILSEEYFDIFFEIKSQKCFVSSSASIDPCFIEYVNSRAPKWLSINDSILHFTKTIFRVKELIKEIQKLSVPCKVSFDKSLIIDCEFFNYENHIKFDAKFSITEYPFCMLDVVFNIEYGDVLEWKNECGKFNNLTSCVESIKKLLK